MPPRPVVRDRWTLRGEAAGTTSGVAPPEVLLAASLDGRHLWLGLEHDADTPPPDVRLGVDDVWLASWPAEPAAPPVAPGRARAAWRVPIPGPDVPGDLSVDFHHEGRSVPVRVRLDDAATSPRSSPDGRTLVTVAVLGDRLVVCRTPRPASVPVTAWDHDGAEVVVRCAWPDPVEVLLLRAGSPAQPLASSHADGTLAVRLPARLALVPGERARVVADTGTGRLPLRRRHGDLARPDRAVALPLLGDRHGGSDLRLRYDRSGALLVVRAADDEASP